MSCVFFFAAKMPPTNLFRIRKNFDENSDKVFESLLTTLRLIRYSKPEMSWEIAKTEMSWEIAKVMYFISSDFPQRALLRNALGN